MMRELSRPDRDALLEIFRSIETSAGSVVRVLKVDGADPDTLGRLLSDMLGEWDAALAIIERHHLLDGKPAGNA
jgi:hypothetical protein